MRQMVWAGLCQDGRKTYENESPDCVSQMKVRSLREVTTCAVLLWWYETSAVFTPLLYNCRLIGVVMNIMNITTFRK